VQLTWTATTLLFQIHLNSKYASSIRHLCKEEMQGTSEIVGNPPQLTFMAANRSGRYRQAVVGDQSCTLYDSNNHQNWKPSFRYKMVRVIKMILFCTLYAYSEIQIDYSEIQIAFEGMYRFAPVLRP